MTNEIISQYPITTYLAAMNPMSIGARQLHDHLVEVNKEAGLPEMSQHDKDTIAVGFIHGCSFTIDLFNEILKIGNASFRELALKMMIAKMSNERSRLAEQAEEQSNS